MTYVWSGAGFAIGSLLCTRVLLGYRMLGLGIITSSIIWLATPARADQTLMVADNSAVNCKASAKDLTRISLVGDEFASVSKISTGNELEDFGVVNEPVRGDIYLSVPEGFRAKSLSFFATTKKGFVYKFSCPVEGEEAQQVFLTNASIAQQKAADWEGQSDPEDSTVRLVQAMYDNSIINGYAVKQLVLTPVVRGALKVQLLSEYRGFDLVGKSLRIENVSSKPLTLTESQIDPRSPLAVSIVEPNLQPGQVTTAYVVTRQGD